MKMLLFAGFVLLLDGCGPQVKSVRMYDRANFIGRWQARNAIMSSAKNRGDRIEVRVSRYGSISCEINPDSTFALDIDIDRDVVVKDDQRWISNERVLVHAGYKMFTTGTFAYRDSTADFYNYDHRRHFRTILYTYGGDFYMTYVDEKQNEWKLQFEKAD